MRTFLEVIARPAQTFVRVAVFRFCRLLPRVLCRACGFSAGGGAEAASRRKSILMSKWYKEVLMAKNVIIGQSGGPTAVINSSLAGVYKAACSLGADKVYGM